ncbi:peroxide stress protein YaaA [Tropicimonas sp. S265A]|uniref:peroxide stress protein YaaA n=1 Tax=Tropicimonas sp. S265A TaxID=3415134 RepID=UPI003C7B6683
MLVVISPAKRLNWEVSAPLPTTLPEFETQASALAREARKLDTDALRQLMGLSEKLADLNHARFKSFRPKTTDAESRPAALAFAGDTYVGLDAQSLSSDEWRYAQDHLRILSGLYGVLRPLDLIQAYRLEMGSRLETRRGKTLYDWWGTRISKSLNAQAESVGASVLMNCASQEYFGAVDIKVLRPRLVTPVFLEDRDGVTKTVSFFAKKARGAMARFIVQNRVCDLEGLRDFATGGYAFDKTRSTPDAPVFVRPYPDTTSAEAA